MTTKKCRIREYHPFIDEYMDDIRSGKIPASKEILQAMDLVEDKLTKEGVHLEIDMIDKAVELMERYFDIKLLNWELFIIACIHAYNPNDTVVFDEFLLMLGRGNGKNGFISPVAWYLTTHYHGIKGYNIDIIANSEDQARTSFDDIYEVLEGAWKKLKKFFYKSRQKIVNLKTNSYIKYNTSNSKTKDGKRSACLIFDEIHEYEDYSMIKVFQSGFGKRKHSRVFYITTNGYVRGGVLDEMLDLAKRVLEGDIKDLGLLPMIYKIDEKEEAENPDMWIKACPSLPYFPELQVEMKKEFTKMKYQFHIAQDFMTKRMNIPAQDTFMIVAPREKVLATNRPIPYENLKGGICIGCIDYALLSDFASVGLLFRHGEEIVFMEHTFICENSLKMESREIKFPVYEAEEKGLVTIIKDGQIQPEYIANWFLAKSKEYSIQTIVADKFRITLLRSKFQEAGLPLEEVRSGPITHALVAPLIEDLFENEKLVFGDNMTMRWYINNTYKDLDGKGNITYKKIEPKTRKTDGFFAFLHGMSKESLLPSEQHYMDIDIRTY